MAVFVVFQKLMTAFVRYGKSMTNEDFFDKRKFISHATRVPQAVRL